MKDLETYIQQISQLSIDLRAEVVVADLLEDGVKINDIWVNNVGLFRRNFEHDIGKIEAIENSKSKYKKLKLSLNRDGLYDNLPEGLFHQPSSEKTGKNKQDILREIKVQKKREEAARTFFSPLEQEFFGVRVRLELEERKYLFDAGSLLDNDMFAKFWGLPKFLTDKQLHNLLYLLPMMPRIVGDWERTKLSFENILEDAVELEFKQPMKYPMVENEVFLGDFRLGIDSVIGEEYQDVFNSVCIKITPSKPEKIAAYLPDAQLEKVVNFLGNYLLPVETDFSIELNILPDYQVFSLTDEAFSGRLNYTTILK